MIDDDDGRAEWVARRRRNPALTPVADCGRAYYRRRELLLPRAAVDRRLLADRYGADRYEPGRYKDDWRARLGCGTDLNDRLTALGLELWVLGDDVDVDLPATVRDDADVFLNHVLVGEANKYQGGPGSSPTAAAPLELPEPPPGEDVALAVLDTGVPQGWAELHPALGNLRPDSTDIDVLDEDGDQKLDKQAGHGLFIAGIALRVAPDLTIDPGLVLGPTGVGDDASVAVELAEVTAPVINLSFGGYTDDDVCPPGLRAAIAALSARGTAVVAAAGNAGEDPAFRDRPFWPAALDEVIAVGAYDSTADDAADGSPPLAPFSNACPWVDVYAPGVDLCSTYVRSEMTDEYGMQFDGWASWSGTSFAAPQVAAYIASRLPSARGRTARELGWELVAGLATTVSSGRRYYVPPQELTG